MGVCARDIMTCPVVCAREEMTLQQLVQLLQEHQITGAPVIDGTGALRGVVSMTDVVFSDEMFGEGPVLESDYHRQTDVASGESAPGLQLEDLGDRRVGDILSPEAITVGAETSMEELAGVMFTHRIHRVIVVEEGRVAGIVSTMDVLRAVMQGKAT